MLKRTRLLFLSFVTLGAASLPAHAALKTWTSPLAGNASVNGNWSPAAAPVTGDDVLFNSGGTGDCTWDLAAPVFSSFTVTSGYTGTIGMESPGLTTFTGAFTVNGSTIEFRDGFGPFLIQNEVTTGGGKFHVGQTTVTVDVGSITVNAGGMVDFHDLALIRANTFYIAPGGTLHLFDNAGGFTGGPTLTSTSSASFLILTVDGQVDVTSATFQRLDPGGLKIGAGAVILNFSTATFAGPLQPGATAVNFYSGGTFTSTFTNVRFTDPQTAVNINGSLLSAGHITMRETMFSPGLRAGPNFENDPGGHVDWPEFDKENCGSYAKVMQNGSGDVTTIQAGVDLSPKTLAAGNHCVGVGAGTYAEQVNIAGINTNNFRVVIDTENSASTPVVSPPAFSTAAFAIANSSVSIIGINIRPTNSITFGVTVTSPSVVLSSVNVDSAGKITTAGISLGSNQGLVAYSSVTVQSANGIFVGAGANAVLYSTAAAGSSAGAGLAVQNASSNTFSNCFFSNSSGSGVSITGSSTVNLINLSTMTSAGTGACAVYTNASSNTVTYSFISNPSGYGLYLDNGSNFNTVRQSTVSNAPSSNPAVQLNRASTNTFTNDYLYSANFAAYFTNSSSNNLVSQSQLNTSGSFLAALQIDGKSSGNSVTQSALSAPNGYAAFLTGGARYTSFSFSALSNTSSGAGLLLSDAATTTVTNSTLQGAAAAYIYESTGTSISSSSLAGFDAGIPALTFSEGSVGLTVATCAISAVSNSPVIYIDTGTGGSIYFTSAAVSGGNVGLKVGALTPQASLSISTMIFSGLASGATAIQFLGGTLVSTFTSVNFADNSVAVNVNASALNSGSQIYMVNAVGPRAGPSFQAPDAGFVFWVNTVNLGSLSFSGTFASAGGANIAGTGIYANNSGFGMTIDNVTGGGPYFNFLLASSGTIQGLTSPPETRTLVRYDSAGNLAGSQSLFPADSGTPSLTLDAAGNIYSFNNAPNGINYLSKFSPSLVLLSSVTLSDAIGGDAWLASDGAFIYAAHKGASGPTPAAQIVKYNTSLVAVATATYQIEGLQTDVLAIDVDGSGSVHVILSTGGSGTSFGGVKHLVEYADTLSGSSAAVDISFFAGSLLGLAKQGSAVYVAGATQLGPMLVAVRKFDAGTLAASGAPFTLATATGSVLAFPILRRSPDGTIILSGSQLTGSNEDYGAIKFDTNLNILSSATFNGPANGIDNVGGMRVLDANTVVVTGMSQNGLGGFDAATVKLSLATPGLNFTGTFTAPTGALIANSANFSPGEQIGRIVSDGLTSGGPYAYAILNASLAPSVNTYYVIKYDVNGVKLASAPVPGYVNPGPIAVDSSGNVYVGYKDQTANRTFLRKYSTSLNVLTTVEISTNAVGIPAYMTVNGTELYVLYPGISGGPAKAVRYDLSLATISTATAPAFFTTANSLDTDEAGNVYIAWSDCSDGCTSVVEKYDAAFAARLASAPVAGLSNGQLALSAAGSYAYVAAVAPPNLTVSKLLSSDLTPTGLVSTFTTVLASLALVKAAPDGNVYAAGIVDTSLGSTISALALPGGAPGGPASSASYSDGWGQSARAPGGLRAQTGGTGAALAIRYDQNLHMLSSATFASTSGPASFSYGLAVVNPATVLLSGAITNTATSKNDGAAARLTLGPTALPEATCAPATLALSVSSIRWSLPNAFTYHPLTYNVYSGSGLRLASVSTGTFDYAQLSTNTAYTVAFAGVNGLGEGQRSMAVRAYTLAAPPLGSTAEVFTTSATLAWRLNENPPATRAWVDKSTDAQFRVQATTLAAMTSYTDATLLACTSYYFRVRNLNGDGYPTDYDGVLSFRTPDSTPTAPGAFSAESLPGNRIAFNWNPSGPEGITGYNLYFDAGTGVVPSTGAAPYAVLPPSATSFVTGVLPSTGAYSFHLTAANRCGVEDAAGAYAAAASTLKPSAFRAAVAGSQSGRGAAIDGASNSVTVAASILAGGVSRVLFQYKGTGDWTDIGWAAAFPYAVSWDVTGLAAGSYQLRAVAYDAAGNADAAPAAVTVAVAAPGTPGAAGETSIGGVVTKTLLLDNSAVNTLATSAAGRMTELTIAPGALNAANAVVSVVPNPSAADLASVPFPDGLNVSAGIVTKITLGAGQSLLPGATASFTLSYPDADDNGIIDGTSLRADAVRLISHSGLPGAAWNQDIETTVDLARHTLTGLTSHFSFFAVAGAVQVNLDSVRVYPVPYKPNGADASEGRPYTGAAATGIVFDNLPAVVTIKIYSVSGTLVAKLTSNAGTGMLVWDARSDSGKDVASGGYFAVITTPGFKPLTKRLAIIR